MNEHQAVEALEDLGLTNYEAKVFIALQRLGAGSARDVAQVSDVPRPQVYSTAESLEASGLIDVQQSEPIRYRPVPIDEAKTRLRNHFERKQETAFEFIEKVHAEGPADEQQEDIWTLSGQETITDRIAHLIRAAEREVLFAIESAAFVGEDTSVALRQAADAGVAVTILCPDTAVIEAFEDDDCIDVIDDAIDDYEEVTGRLLVVDETTVLLSAFGDETTDGSAETAIWSGDTEFARVLIRIIRQQL